MNRLLKIIIGVWVFVLAGCSKEEDFLIDQRESFESYLSRQEGGYTVEGGVYRYVVNADREGYANDPVIEYGDSVTFNFAAYTFGSPLGTLYYTNVQEWLSAGSTNLNTAYWDMTPSRVRLGYTPLLKGVESGLVGNRMNDSLLLFVTSDLAYGSVSVGAIGPDEPTVWSVKINNVVKQ